VNTIRNAPAAPPSTPPPVGTRMIGFFLLGGTMWIAGLFALFRAVMAVVPS
jgi:hypothetical protein